jgi:SOS-response transcriptional repressor LexA
VDAQEADGPKRVFPIRVEALDDPAPGEARDAVGGCSSGESFALMVLGDSMLPEFAEGEIIVIEPDGLATEGSFVFARCNDEWIFRQLARDAAGGWMLRPLNPAYPDLPIADLSAVRGVIIQKSKPGRRRASKRYVA